jgi:hypothetical protein
MKYAIISLVFVATPFFLLNQFVMPALESLEQVYANADKIAEQAVGSAPSVSGQQNRDRKNQETIIAR